MNKFSAIMIACLFASNAQATSFRYNYSLFGGEIPPNWQQTDSQYGEWKNIDNPYDCTNWSPSTSSQGKGILFTQVATDCKQHQERWAQDYLRNNITGDLEKTGAEYTEKRDVTASDDRQAVGILENWMPFDPTYTSWVDTNVLYGCTAWTPDPSVYSASTNFTQTSNTCKTDQERQRQEREQEAFTDEIRDVGAPVTEQQTLASQSASRPYSVTLGGWTDVGPSYACSNWSPAVETIGKGIAFTQTASDCKLDQTRTRTESYVDHRSGSTVPVAKANENRVLNNQAGSRGAVGTLEEWEATTPTYTAWIDTNAQHGCSVWSPLPSSKTTTTTFIQTAADCKTDQTRNRQDREKEKNTGAIRDKGTPVVENQTLNAQSATRSYTVNLGAWTNNGAKYACTNWSPAPSTVTINQPFTQTATDCKQDQTRTRAESYVDHKSGSTVAVSVPSEAQTLSGQTHTQGAIGTKETWVAIAPTYTAWANSGDVYNCSGWAPSPSNYNVATQFTQTTSACSINQSRTRQDREQETTTQAVRNKGAAVVEGQTIGGQYGTRTYLQDFSGWTWVGGFYNCGGWSPDPSTVTIGVAFTQTQYCYRNMERAAAGYTWGGTHWVADPANPYRMETVATPGQPNYQTAYGTKETWVAIAPTYTAWVNSSDAYNCNGSWAPSPSNYNVATQFTQTTYSCSINQSRTRQDREQETTTLAVRNKGAAVAEGQTIGGQYGARTYLQDYSGWFWSGDFYGCGGWSPDPSTVNSGVAFTQTQYCYRNQQRGAAGYILVNGGWAADPANPYRVETVAYSGQPNYQTAYGTKPTLVCKYSNGYDHWQNYGRGAYTEIRWGGVNVGFVRGTVTSYAAGGYTYTRGAYKTDVYNMDYEAYDPQYEICRQ